MATINLEIDGKPVQVEGGSTVMDAATKLGVFVPHFCYHKKLSIAANCRMCLVQVEKAPKPLPACATPVAEGMKVFTQSEPAVKAQKGVMEFLLINHPLDCPICDQGGECQLQDLAVGYGGSSSRYQEEKRVVVNKNLGALISTDMTRCIHCTRCVRFGQEVAGVMELGMAGRGEHSEILAFVGKTVDSELSGNMIDLCPVGALTSKPFRYSARTWELARRRTVSPHDGLGSNLVAQVKQDRVMRVVPQENETINECWLSDRDRFAYEGLNSDDRLMKPLVRRGESLVETTWAEALEVAAKGLRETLSAHGPASLATLVAPWLTLEELHLATKLSRSLGSDNIEHRIRARDARTAFVGAPWLGMPIAEVGGLQAALVIGSSLRNEHPLLAGRLRQATKKGLAVSVVHVAEEDLLMPVAARLTTRPSALAASLVGVARACAEKTGQALAGDVRRAAEEITVTAEARAIADALVGRERAAVFLGNYAQQHPDYAVLVAAASEIARVTGAKFGVLTSAANAVGAAMVGAQPRADGLGIAGLLSAKPRAFIVAGFEPDRDAALAKDLTAALAASHCAIALTAWRGDVDEWADVVLPIVPSTETGGTFVSMEGRAQTFHPVANPLGEARPGWKVLRMLGTLLEVPGFEFDTLEAVRADIGADLPAKVCASVSNAPAPLSFTLAPASQGLERIADWPLYGTDPQVRRAASLQRSAQAKAARTARMNAATAASLNLAAGGHARISQGAGEAILPVAIDATLPDQCVRIACSTPEAAALGEGAITLSPVSVGAAA